MSWLQVLTTTHTRWIVITSNGSEQLLNGSMMQPSYAPLFITVVNSSSKTRL
jgi:hypothetical protein